MPDLVLRKGPTVSLIQDQDVVLTTEPGLSDLIITIIGPTGEDGAKHITDILVASDVCKKSPYLKALLDEQPDQTELTFGGKVNSKDDGENKEGTLVWLARLHDLPEQRLRDLGLFEISLIGVWHAMSLWSTHQDDKIEDNLQDWFNIWYDTSMTKADLTIPIAQWLAYPCYTFNHAAGYARVTKYLVYENIGHIKQRQPNDFKGSKQHHIKEREFVDPLNHARGGLRNTLHKSLYSRVGHILRSEASLCSCWDAAIGRYLFALTKCNAWPVDDVLNYSSITQVVRRLKAFSYNYTPKCARCRSVDWETIVLKAQSNTLGYFNGMCLDCMHRSKPPCGGGTPDDEYEKRNQSINNRWDTQCRIKHGQPTWYISWLGRPDMREKILRGPEHYRASED
ncbi:MFS transporter [Pyrenophora seminiperda CCB06]|uniref:MFS transporter n=1 Tax=Pyrenophora seminiperda CCB06 TaxID=1302712 RepID=A0A3M7LV13_9PLEO|nr:MFS transporter [Pyrenophora seminiperda CCB06]